VDDFQILTVTQKLERRSGPIEFPILLAWRDCELVYDGSVGGAFNRSPTRDLALDKLLE
jgi:hypothetical protein